MTELDLFLQSDTYNNLIARPDIFAAFIGGSRLLGLNTAKSDYDIIFLSTNEQNLPRFNYDHNRFKHLHWTIENVYLNFDINIKNTNFLYGLLIDLTITVDSKNILYFDENKLDEFNNWKHRYISTLKQMQRVCVEYYAPMIKRFLDRSWTRHNKPTQKMIYRSLVILDIFFDNIIDYEFILKIRNMAIDEILISDDIMHEIDKKFLLIYRLDS